MSIFSCCFRARSVGSPNCQQNPGPCTPDNKGPRFLYDENKDVIGIDNSGAWRHLLLTGDSVALSAL